MNRIFGLRRSRRQCGEDPPTPARNEQPTHGGEQEEPHGHTIDEADAPFIDLESEREMQAYNLMKEREFLHSPTFDPTFLHQIGMDVEFDTIFEHLGWSRVAPIRAWVTSFDDPNFGHSTNCQLWYCLPLIWKIFRYLL